MRDTSKMGAKEKEEYEKAAKAHLDYFEQHKKAAAEARAKGKKPPVYHNPMSAYFD